MKILVTGGAGYIGSHTCVELLAAGHEPVVIDNFVNSSEESVKRAEKISGKKIPLYCGDVRDGELLERIFNENKIEWVIHFAGLKAVGESCAKPIEYYDNNLGGTMSLLNAMRAHGCKKIVFSSSATVYGTPEKLPLDETCRVGDTTNPYGTSKFFQDIMHDSRGDIPRSLHTRKGSAGSEGRLPGGTRGEACGLTAGSRKGRLQDFHRKE